MRVIILVVLMASFSKLKAQTFIPGSFINNAYRENFAGNIQPGDSSLKKKWSISRYSGLSTSFIFFKGGNAAVFSAPLGLQLNRRLNNNLYAFAGVSLAPSYVSFNRSFMTEDFSKSNQNNSFFNSKAVGLYSRAALGLQYINDGKTFSISGSIGVERSSYPILPYNSLNNTRTNRNISANR